MKRLKPEPDVVEAGGTWEFSSTPSCSSHGGQQLHFKPYRAEGPNAWRCLACYLDARDKVRKNGDASSWEQGKGDPMPDKWWRS